MSNAAVARWSWLRPLPWLLGAFLLRYGAQAHEEQSHGVQAVSADAVHPTGLELSELVWVDPRPEGMETLWRRPRVLAVASRPKEPTDIYLSTGRFGPGGRLRELSPLQNVTRTRGLAEHGVRVHGRRAAWLLSSPDGTTGATVLTFEPPPTVARLACWVFEGDDCPTIEHQQTWTKLQRWQQRIQNWQELGSPGQVELRTARIAPPARRVQLHLEDGGERLWLDGELFVSGGGAAATPGDVSTLRWDTEAIGRPGNVTTWLAERLRESPLGERGVSLLKAVGFAGRDYARRAATTLFDEGAANDAPEDLGVTLRRPAVSAPDGPHIEGWPPAPLTPPLAPGAPNEGAWLSLDDDPFVARTPEGHAPFLFTFLRPDAKRPHVNVYVVLWDPRRVELHAVGGTTEPRSDRGERGSGRIPRDPRVLERLAGAFNGAFRTRHGEFGMAAEGTLYIPPKPYAATIATLEDGSTALGTWPDAPGLPSAIRSFRQNMTPLLQDGRANPYRRHWWGGTPEGWQHESFTVRTALCLTREGFLAYLYGDFLDPDSLITAGKALRCTYAVHLDMNAGHTGFELYQVARTGESPLPEPLDPSWQARGSVPDARGFEFIARRMTRRMPLMNFPRYIHREQRDFFYLTLRPSVGQRRLPAEWRAQGPAGGWELGPPGPCGAPTPWAHASVRPFEADVELGVQLLAIDPTRVLPCAEGERPSLTNQSLRTGAPPECSQTALGVADPAARQFAAVESGGRLGGLTPVAMRPGAVETDGPYLWWDAGRFSLAARPSQAARPVAHLVPATGTKDAKALVGVDADGFLVYAEVEGARAVSEQSLLALAGPLALHPALPLRERLRWHLTDASAAADPVTPPDSRRVAAGTDEAERPLRTTLWATEGPRATRLFPETPVVAPRVWAYRQLTHLPVAGLPEAAPGDLER